MAGTIQLKPLALACSAATLLLAVPSAHAVKFDWGEVEGTFTSTFSVGASWRMEDPDWDHLSPGNTDGRGRASVSTTDDGNLNYEKHDAFSVLLKGVHDLDLNAGSYGAFTRVKYWYDYIQAEEEVDHGHVPNEYIPDEKLEMGDFEDLAQDSGFEFLDYYVYADLELGEMPLDLRAGNMVVSWGESTFIQGGVNTINPFDVTALRKPGSEIKEALLPTGLIYGNLGVTGALSVEAFYQYEWDRTILDECGTYWSAADIYGGGCDKLTVSTNSSDFDQIQPGTDFFIARAPDEDPSDSGQWGIAARYFAESLNATEFGAYYINYHSRTPILSGITAEENDGPFLFGAEPFYFFEYPEDIEVYALTFATNVVDWAVSGEVSYRPDFPLQINTVDVSQALALGSWAEWSRVDDRREEAGLGGVLRGYDEVEYTQAQMTFIKFFEQIWGASRLSFAAEVGATWLDDMDGAKNYGRHGTFGIGSFEPIMSEVFPGVEISCNSHTALEALASTKPNNQARNCNNDGFTDDFAWGYRVRASLDYSDVFMGVNLKPNMAWSHDVDGNGPAPTFIEDRMAFSLGVTGDYLNKYKADISYTTFFGADYNETQDRDFLSLSFSVAF